ncbi:WD40-repeat-containing domain protein [Nemania sp. FL0031]|nr:WD40-repeat-containing domain protein [Nemania sp. FL0031]
MEGLTMPIRNRSDDSDPEEMQGETVLPDASSSQYQAGDFQARGSDEDSDSLSETTENDDIASESPEDILRSLIRETDGYMNICSWDENDKNDNALLWIKGTTGEGKTMLMKSIIQELSKSSPQCLSFFLFNSLSPDANNAAAALKSLIWGVLAHQQGLSTHLRSKFDTTGRMEFDDPHDFLALSGVLREMILDPDFPQTYFVVDSLDECSSKSGIPGLTDLVKFIQDSIRESGRVRWIVSSDFSDAIQSAFSENKQCVTIDMGSLDCSDAVKNYIRSEVGNLSEDKGYDKDLESAIIAALCDRYPGDYLQVDLICEALKLEKARHAESVLDEVKARNDLDSLYGYFNAKFANLPTDEGALCSEILSTMAVISQPLTLDELEGLVLPKSREDLGSIIKKCSCFLRVSGNGDVSFRHHSARNYIYNRIENTSQVYSKIIQRGIDSLVKVLTRATDKEHSTPNGFISLGWIDHLCGMANEAAVSNEWEKVANGILLFLRGHSGPWFEALNSGDLVARATILLRKAYFLLNAKGNLRGQLLEAIRETLDVTSYHRWTETPNHISIRNTIQLCEIKDIFKTRYLEDIDSQIEVRQLGSAGAQRHRFASFKGHTGTVNSVVFSLDGRLIVSGSDDRSVRVWDAEMGTTQHTLRIEQHCILSVAFSSKGHIAAGSNEGSITIWDSSSGRQLRTMHQDGHICALVFSPDGKYLAAGGFLGLRKLRLWDLDPQGSGYRDVANDSDQISSISFSADGKLLAWGGGDDKIRVWDHQQPPSPLTLFGHTGTVNSVAFSPKRPGCLASSSSDGTTKIWALDTESDSRSLDAKIHRCILTLESPGEVNSITFSPNGLRLAAATDTNIIDIWDVDAGRRLEMMRAPEESRTRSIAFSPSGSYISSASEDGYVHLWYATDQRAEKARVVPSSVVRWPVTELTVAPNGQTIATGHTDGKVVLWNMDDDGEPVRLTEKSPTLSGPVNCLAFSPDGLSLASSSDFPDPYVRIYNVAKLERVAHFRGRREHVDAVTWSPEGKYLASSSGSRSVRVYNVDDKSMVKIRHEKLVRAIAFSPHESNLYLAVGDKNGSIVVRKQVEGGWEPQYTIPGSHRGWVQSIVFTPDGKRIVSVGDDYTLRVWDIGTERFAGEVIVLDCQKPLLHIQTEVVQTRMRFERGQERWGYVMTETGAQWIDPSTTNTIPDWCPYGYEGGEDEDDEDWITCHGKQDVFIPERLSPSRPSAVYIMGNKVIIGLRNGLVRVFRFSEQFSERFSENVPSHVSPNPDS